MGIYAFVFSVSQTDEDGSQVKQKRVKRRLVVLGPFLYVCVCVMMMMHVADFSRFLLGLVAGWLA